MIISELDYALPEALIAQRPASPRDASRLMAVDAKAGTITHHVFRDLPRFLSPGDALVLNETKVLPARLLARRPGGGKVELLFLRDLGGPWEALARPSKRLKPGMALAAGEDELEVVKSLGEGRWMVAGDDLRGMMERQGRMPLPPYIEATDEAEEAYQTVYARHPGVPLHGGGARGSPEDRGGDSTRNATRRHGNFRPDPYPEARRPPDARRALRRPGGGCAKGEGCREGRCGRDDGGADSRVLGRERRARG